MIISSTDEHAPFPVSGKLNTQYFMQILEATLAPISLEEFKTHYDEGKCLVVEGDTSKFDGLITLEDIERRLNDGANANTFPQVIINGARQSFVDSNSPWSAACLKKRAFAESIASGQSFMLSNSSQISKGLARLSDEIEHYFAEDHIHADVHLYVSMSDKGNSYYAHRDRPQHKVLLQVVGDANWQLFEPIEELPNDLVAVAEDDQESLLRLVSEFTLTQGDMLYMPPGVFHRVSSVPGPRVSASIPFYSMPEASQMDRTHIPFASLFKA